MKLFTKLFDGKFLIRFMLWEWYEIDSEFMFNWCSKDLILNYFRINWCLMFIAKLKSVSEIWGLGKFLEFRIKICLSRFIELMVFNNELTTEHHLIMKPYKFKLL